MALIAQLSDTHIRAGRSFAYGRVDTATHLEAAVRHLNALQPRPAAVVISGDLIETGQDEDYRTFLDLIAPLEIPWWPLPGNHDGPGFWSMLPPVRDLPLTGRDCYGVEAESIRLVLLDTSVAGAGHGDITAARAKALRAELDAAAGTPTLVFMHHPPFDTGIAHMDRIGCRNSALFTEILRGRPDILAVGCGHIHRLIATHISGVPVFVAPSPAHAVTLDLAPDGAETFHMEPPGVLLYRVEQTKGTIGLALHLSHIGTYDGPFPFADDDDVPAA